MFDFGYGWRIVTQCLWQLRNPERVVWTVEDDGHQFGLPAPVDAQAEVNDSLAGHSVLNCAADVSTGDLHILFDGGWTLDVISTSGEYESWQAYLGGTLVVGRGDGLIVFEKTK